MLIINLISELQKKYTDTNLDKLLYDCIPKIYLAKLTKEVLNKKIEKVDSKIVYERIKLMKPKPKTLYKVRGMIQDLGNDVLSINWEFYRRSLTLSGNKRLIDKFQLPRRLMSYELAKNLSDYGLKNGPKVKGYRYLIGIDHLYGYLYDPDETDIVEKLKLWIQNDFEPNFEGSRETFYDIFDDEVRKILNLNVGTSPMDLTAEQFVTQIPLTSTAGAAYDRAFKEHEIIIVGDQEVKVRNTKFSRSLLLGVKNKLKRLFQIGDLNNKATIKVEPYPKLRLIVGADFNFSLKERFVDYWLEKVMKGGKESTMWQDSEESLKMWIEFCKQDSWNVPIDQKNMDHKITKEMNRIIYEAIKSRAKQEGDSTLEIREVVDSLIEGQNRTYVQYTDLNGKNWNLKWKSGMLSGRQFTAKFESIINVVEKNMALIMLRRRGVKYNLKLFNAQGDDQLTKFETLSSGLAYWAALSSMGLEIHLTKNFFSKIHNEYLRRGSDSEGMNGYPARMVNSIMWIYPGTEYERNQLTRLSGLKDKWNKYAERLKVNFKKVNGWFVEDATKSKISSDLIKVYTHGLKINGCAQLLEPIIYDKKIVQIIGERTKKIMVEGEGYRDFQENYGIDQSLDLKKWVIKSLNIEKELKKNEAIKDNEVVIEQIGNEVREKKFVIAKNVSVIKPNIIKGWSIKSVFGKNKEFITKIFPGFDQLVANSKAPRSWVVDMILGQVKFISPRIFGVSEEMSSMIFKPYENSVIYAMMRKRMRGYSQRWESLMKYYLREFPSQIIGELEIPSEFY